MTKQQNGHVKLLTRLLVVWAIVSTATARAQDDRTKTIDAIKKLGGRIKSTQASPSEIGIEFHLRGRDLTDSDLKLVAKLGSVVLLNLRDTKITSEGLLHLKGLASLQQLHLERTSVDDRGMPYLAKLKNLKYLNLYGTKVTDQGLKHLGELTNLEQLYVWQTQVTERGAAGLEKRLPKLEVVMGVDLSKIPIPAPAPPKKPPVALKWMTDNVAQAPKSKPGPGTRVTFENKRSKPVKVYWIGYGGEHKLYHTLAPNQQREQNTYSMATWLITELDDTPVGYFITGEPESLAVIPK